MMDGYGCLPSTFKIPARKIPARQPNRDIRAMTLPSQLASQAVQTSQPVQGSRPPADWSQRTRTARLLLDNGMVL